MRRERAPTLPRRPVCMLTLCYELLFMISHNSFFNGEAQRDSAIALGVKAKRQGRWDGCEGTGPPLLSQKSLGLTNYERLPAVLWKGKKKGKQGKGRKKERKVLGHMLVWVTATGHCQAPFFKCFCDCCVVPFTFIFYFKMLRFGRVLKGHLFHLLLN